MEFSKNGRGRKPKNSKGGLHGNEDELLFSNHTMDVEREEMQLE